MSVIFLLFSLLSLLYYLIWAISVSPRASVLYAWLLASGVFFLFALCPAVFFWTLPLSLPLFFFFCLFLFRAAKKKGKASQKPEILLLLGARDDGTLPREVSKGRLRLAVSLFKENESLSAVLSGGMVFGETRSEAASLAAGLLAEGIEQDRLILEEKSRTTVENLLFSAPLFSKAGCVGIVTSSYHAHRVWAIAKSLLPDTEICLYTASVPPLYLPHLYLREFITLSVDILLKNIRFQYAFGGKK